jgi:hypothetical protein
MRWRQEIKVKTINVGNTVSAPNDSDSNGTTARSLNYQKIMIDRIPSGIRGSAFIQAQMDLFCWITPMEYASSAIKRKVI